jgi:hypothetical protein
LPKIWQQKPTIEPPSVTYSADLLKTLFEAGGALHATDLHKEFTKLLNTIPTAPPGHRPAVTVSQVTNTDTGKHSLALEWDAPKVPGARGFPNRHLQHFKLDGSDAGLAIENSNTRGSSGRGY